jgi:hypothetical protein
MNVFLEEARPQIAQDEIEIATNFQSWNSIKITWTKITSVVIHKISYDHVMKKVYFNTFLKFGRPRSNFMKLFYP